MRPGDTASGAADAAATGLALPARLSLISTPWISGLALAGLTPVLAAVGAHYADVPGSATLVRLMVTIVGGAMVFGAPLGGLLAEKFGERRVLLTALALFAVAGSAGYLVENIYLLLATRVLLGFATAAIGVCAATLITLRIPGHQQHRWLGFYATSGTVGALIVLPITGWLGGIDWRLIFPLHLLALPILLFVATTVPAARPAARAAQAAGAIPGGSFPWHLLVVAIACGAISTTLPAFLPFHLATIGEGAPERIAGAMMPMALCTGIVALFYGTVRRRLDVAQVFAVAFLVSALGLAIVIYAASYGVVLIGQAVSGLGMGLIAPNLFGAAAQLTAPERRARTIGITRAGFFGAPLLAQLPLEPITAAHGPAAALSALAAFAVVATGLVLLARRAFVPVPAMAA